jgi:choline dehydrogenase
MADTFDVLVLGGGSAGCVLASRLSVDERCRVCLVEAGPDYGTSDSGRWPADILDGRLPATSHDWSDSAGSLPVARILGGCSAHNMCTLMYGAPADYDGWAEATGDPTLGYARFEPYLLRARERMTQRRFEHAELDPWYRGIAAASRELGLPVPDDGNDPGATVGIAPLPFNLRGTTRWNAAFVYLDAARDRRNLEILSGALVDRVLLRDQRATGAEIVRDGERRTLGAHTVVLCAGAYGSPSILTRSGIGPAAELDRLGIDAAAQLPVGERLRDHFGIPVRFAPSEAMATEIAAHRETTDDATIQGIFKARSSSCPDGLWDMHLLTSVFPTPDGVVLAASSMLLQAEWEGKVRLRSTDPAELPAVTELDLETGDDLSHALEGVELARSLAATKSLEGKVANELTPGAGTPGEILARGRAGLTTYFHPVGTCSMGAVTDAECRVIGFENLHVVDASIIPKPVRAGPHLTVLALAERAAEHLNG